MNSVATLTSLPPELLSKITDEATKADLKVLRSTCSVMAEFFQDRVLKSIVIDLNNCNIERNVAKIQSLASSKGNKALGAIKELKLLGLNPHFHPRVVARSVYSESEDRWITVLEPEIDKEAAARGERVLRDYLGEVILSLHSLSVIRWDLVKLGETPSWVSQLVMIALSKNGHNVKVLDLTLGSLDQASLIFLTFKWPFANIHHLRTNLPHGVSTDLTQITQAIASIVQNSSQLKSFEIEAGNCKIGLDQVGLGAGVGSLNSISFISPSAYTVPSPFDFGSALRGLTSLDIKDTRGRHLAPSRYQKSQPSQPSGQDIWELFKASDHIRLQKIKAAPITDSLLDYLSSYSGVVTDIELVNTATRSAEDSNRLANKFFQKVLPKHKRVLTRLSLLSGYEGEWCITREKLKMDLAGCTRLRYLTVSIIGSDLRFGPPRLGAPTHAAPDRDDFSESNNIIHAFLDTCALTERLPSLQSVQFRTTTLESERGNWCGTGRVRRAKTLWQSLTDSIEIYERRRPISQGVPLSLLGLTFPVLRIQTVNGDYEWTLVKQLDANHVTWRCIKYSSE